MKEIVIAQRIWEKINDVLDYTKPLNKDMWYAHPSYNNNNIPDEEEIITIPAEQRQAVIIRENLSGADYDNKVSYLRQYFYVLTYEEVLQYGGGLLDMWNELQNREPIGDCTIDQCTPTQSGEGWIEDINGDWFKVCETNVIDETVLLSATPHVNDNYGAFGTIVCDDSIYETTILYEPIKNINNTPNENWVFTKDRIIDVWQNDLWRTSSGGTLNGPETYSINNAIYSETNGLLNQYKVTPRQSGSQENWYKQYGFSVCLPFEPNEKYHLFINADDDFEIKIGDKRLYTNRKSSGNAQDSLARQRFSYLIPYTPRSEFDILTAKSVNTYVGETLNVYTYLSIILFKGSLIELKNSREFDKFQVNSGEIITGDKYFVESNNGGYVLYNDVPYGPNEENGIEFTGVDNVTDFTIISDVGETNVYHKGLKDYVVFSCMDADTYRGITYFNKVNTFPSEESDINLKCPIGYTYNACNNTCEKLIYYCNDGGEPKDDTTCPEPINP